MSDTQQRLKDHAGRMAEIAGSLGLGALASTIVTDTTRRLEDQRVRAVFLGEIKQGKSSLINAIIGAPRLPTGVTPTTGAVVLVSGGDTPGLYVEADGEPLRSIPSHEFDQLARGPKSSDVEIQGSLRVVIDRELLPAWLELADTPGINDIARFRSGVSRGELPRADVLVLVLDATQLLNRTELAFLRDAVSAVGGLEESGARLLIAVNRIDLIAQEDRPLLLEYLQREIAGVGGQSKGIEVFLTDARTAGRDPQSDNPGVQGVRDLRDRLFHVTQDVSSVLPARTRAHLLRTAALLAHNASIAARAITLEEKALAVELETLEREMSSQQIDMAHLRSQMAAARERLTSQSNARAQKFREELETMVTSSITSASMRSLSSFLPGSIHDAYLSFAHDETELLRAELDEVTRQAIHTHGEQARRRLFQATLRLGFRGPTIYLPPPSVILEASTVVIGVAGTAVMYFGNVIAGMVMTVAGPLATVFLREKSLSQARAHAKEVLPEALDQATAAFQQQIARVVDGHLSALDEHLVLANVALEEQLVGVLRRAASTVSQLGRRDDGPCDEDRAAADRDQAKADLENLERELAAIRRELNEIPL